MHWQGTMHQNVCFVSIGSRSIGREQSLEYISVPPTYNRQHACSKSYNDCGKHWNLAGKDTQGISTVSKVLIQLQKKAGDSIVPGDVLVEIETDKAQMDFEYQEEGIIAKILKESGEKDVAVGNASTLDREADPRLTFS